MEWEEEEEVGAAVLEGGTISSRLHDTGTAKIRATQEEDTEWFLTCPLIATPEVGGNGAKVHNPSASANATGIGGNGVENDGGQEVLTAIGTEDDATTRVWL